MPYGRSNCDPRRSSSPPCSNEPTELHACPFRVEINDDRETQCTCCESCTYECAMEV